MLAAAAMVGVVIWGPGPTVEVPAAIVVLLVCALHSLARSGAGPQVEAAATTPEEDGGIDSAPSLDTTELWAIGDCLGDTVPQSANDIRGELDQIRGLVADAVATLETAFGDMRTDTAAQRELIDGMIVALADGDDGDKVTIGSFVRSTGDLLAKFVDLTMAASEQSMELVSSIDEMSAHVEDMMDRLSDMSAIAEQTKLLSLNATIEAARAGERGRGFAVVADEVRHLSQSSNEFNDQIRSQLEQIQSSMHRTRSVVHDTATRDANTLMESKTDMEEMTGQVEGLDAMLHDRAGRAAELSDRIGKSTADAVRSLQFEDIVRQVAEHAGQRADELAQFFEDIPAHLRSSSDGDLSHVRQTVVAAAEELTAGAAAQPAAQESLESGSIDLF